VVAIAEPMSLLESTRFINSLHNLNIPFAGLFVNRLLHIEAINKGINSENFSPVELDKYSEQQELLNQLINITENKPLIALPLMETEPIGSANLDLLFAQNKVLQEVKLVKAIPLECPQKILLIPLVMLSVLI
jgi:arsenite-transporting ATPase